MEYLILILLILILAETTFLMTQNHLKIRSNLRKIYIDTSALIDGRILNIARAGFLDGELIIIKDVLRELQLLADGKNSEKRSRARAGLAVAAELERVVGAEVTIIDTNSSAKHQNVDEELLRLAKKNHGAILTLDYNLIKVAEAEKLNTLNINDLALALRNEFLPGEKIKLKILEKGSGRGQGVGHLPDGTMVVVERAGNSIGREVEVEFVKFHETSAGRMIFARVIKDRKY